MPKLHFLTGPRAGECLTLGTGLWTLGRAPDNAVVIREQTVSARHCELLVRGTQVAIRDLGTRNGTFVNGASAVGGVSDVPAGARVRLGAIELQVLEDGTRSHPPPGKRNAEGASSPGDGPASTKLDARCDRWRCPLRKVADPQPTTSVPGQFRHRLLCLAGIIAALAGLAAVVFHLAWG